MAPRTSCAVVFLVLATCGGGDKQARPVVVPAVPSGAHEATCQQLCTLKPGERQCTAKHAEFCLARCRAVLRDLPAACASCVIAAGEQITGDVNTVTNDSYCIVGGPEDLGDCAKACDDAGAAKPAPDLDVLCQFECSFYMQDPTALACSADGERDCLAGCRAAVAARPRMCAQCLIEQTIPVRTCFDDDCDCSPVFRTETDVIDCRTLCDAAPPR